MICSQDKQKCEGVQWVGVPTQSEMKEMANMLVELRDKNHAYHKSMKKLMGDLVEVMGDIAQLQQALVGRVVLVNLPSEEGTMRWRRKPRGRKMRRKVMGRRMMRE